MSTPEDPAELDAIAADDALVERLRSALSPQDAVVWGDDDDDDPEDRSFALLRALQQDVSADLHHVVPAGNVVPLAGRRRGFGRSATVAAVTAGVLSLAGVAAAATSSPGQPMYGVRSAVASAVHGALNAITPSKPVGPAAHRALAATPTATITPPGADVSAAARSVSAARQIEERISTATRLLDAGRPTAAGEVLDQAQRRLPLVLDAALRADYQRQIDLLRARAAALSTPRTTPAAPGRSGDRGRSGANHGGSGRSSSQRPGAEPSHPGAAGQDGVGRADPTGRGNAATARSASPVLSERPTSGRGTSSAR